MDENILVTILVCVHSKTKLHDELLKECLTSLKNQTFKNYKLLIVLDECWDFTKKIVTLFNFNNIKIILNDKAIGHYNAKNIAIPHLDTKYVAFIDADDTWDSTKLEKQMNYIINNDVDFLGTMIKAIVYDTKEEMLPYDYNQYHTHNQIVDKIFSENMIAHGCILTKSECLIKLNGYNELRYAEDWDLWKRAINAGYKFHIIQERLYNYNIGTTTSF